MISPRGERVLAHSARRDKTLHVVTREDLPTYSELMLPTLRAVEALGGSSTRPQISERVMKDVGLTDEHVALAYPANDKSIALDRCDWARSYLKLGGVLESPRRGLFLITELGRTILALSDDVAQTRLREIDAQVRADRRTRGRERDSEGEVEDVSPPDDQDPAWRAQLVTRLHGLAPDGFERFVLYLLRAFGLVLEQTGGPGDEGIDGIGTAPLSEVLSSTVAVQAKRYEPSNTVGRDAVALFQRDAAAAGAERAVFVTLGRFSEPARRVARTATPTIDLIDGERLCDLVEQQSTG
ncbi:MAG: restriction endonuclease, partial [Actinobacteria bacterium]|nr:restriction endonuclease [Actinomycetota bacterium]